MPSVSLSHPFRTPFVALSHPFRIPFAPLPHLCRISSHRSRIAARPCRRSRAHRSAAASYAPRRPNQRRAAWADGRDAVFRAAALMLQPLLLRRPLLLRPAAARLFRPSPSQAFSARSHPLGPSARQKRLPLAGASKDNAAKEATRGRRGARRGGGGGRGGHRHRRPAAARPGPSPPSAPLL